MATIFDIPALNPIRFVPDGYSGENRFDDNFAAELINGYQNKICYLQKWNTADATTLQFLSDFTDHLITVRDLYSNEQITTFTPVDQGVTLQGQTFKVYQTDIAFNALGPGTYYMQLTYTDDVLQTIEHISEPFSVADNWPETLLFTYANSENNFSTLFQTGIKFNFRVEGNIEEFQPESDDVVYTDQKHNLTQLNATPFRSFTLFIADQRGVPPWVADRVNRIMACDQVQIDDGHGPDYYERGEGSTWEAVRASQYAWMGLKTTIQPVENFFLLRLKTQPDDDMATIKIVRRVNSYFNVSGSVAVSGVFDRYAVLDHVVLEKTGANFTLNVGTTPGGTEIGAFDVVDNNTCITIRWYFNVSTTVYFSNIPGTQPFLGVVWDALDAESIDVGGEVEPAVALGTGAVIAFHGTETELNTAFNTITGLGRPDTDWELWALCDGRNGTLDMRGRVPVGWEDGGTRFAVPGTTGGAEQAVIEKNNLPSIQLDVGIPVNFTSQHDVGSGRITCGGAELEPIPGPTLATETLGTDEPVDLMNPYIVTVFVKKIA